MTVVVDVAGATLEGVVHATLDRSAGALDCAVIVLIGPGRSLDFDTAGASFALADIVDGSAKLL